MGEYLDRVRALEQRLKIQNWHKAQTPEAAEAIVSQLVAHNGSFDDSADDKLLLAAVIWALELMHQPVIPERQ